MNNSEAVEILEKVFSDDTFNESIVKASNSGEIKELLATKGIEISAEDAETLLSNISRMKNGEDLSEEELDQVGAGSATLVCAGGLAILGGVGYITYRIGKFFVDKLICRN